MTDEETRRDLQRYGEEVLGLEAAQASRVISLWTSVAAHNGEPLVPQYVERDLERIACGPAW